MESNELKPRSFRLDDETANKIKEISASIGSSNQQETLSKLIEAYEFQTGKERLAGKKEEIEKPFFTVEITNDDTIQQIHGFCNRNVDTEPDLINFIVKWMENNNLKASNYDKVR